MKIIMKVETKRTKRGEIRKFNSTVDALNYMKRKGFKTKDVTIAEKCKNGEMYARSEILSTRTMGYIR